MWAALHPLFLPPQTLTPPAGYTCIDWDHKLAASTLRSKRSSRISLSSIPTYFFFSCRMWLSSHPSSGTWKPRLHLSHSVSTHRRPALPYTDFSSFSWFFFGALPEIHPVFRRVATYKTTLVTTDLSRASICAKSSKFTYQHYPPRVLLIKKSFTCLSA